MPAGGQNTNDNGMAPFAVSAAIVIVGLILYHFFHNEIISGLFWIKGLELHAITLFAPKYQDLLLWMKSAPKNGITPLELKYLARGIGHVLLYPMVIISLIMASIIYFFHQDSNYKEIEDMDSLAKKLSYESPAVKVTEGIDLIKKSLTKGPWAMGKTPVEFAKAHKLLSRDKSTNEIKVDQLKAKMIFSNQLGEPWVGHKQLNPHEKAIYTILTMYILNKRDQAEKLFEDICLSVTKEKLAKNKMNFTLIDKHYNTYANDETVQALVQKHAFKYTVFTGMLEAARKTGIVPNALYLWLKPIDRTLWYVLNNVGRKAVYIEASAIHAHYLAESILGFAIKTPMVDEVVVGLEEAVKIRIIKDIK